MPFWYSIRLSFQIQFRYAPDTDAFLILIQIQLLRYSSDTLQTRMPSCYSFKFKFQIQFRHAPNTDAILILIQTQLSDIVQIHSRYRFHSDTHSDSTFRYNPDTSQIHMSFWRSFSTYFRCGSYTIHLWIFFWYSSHYIYCFSINRPEIYSDTSSNFYQQSPLDDIYKPISENSLSSLQLASLSLFHTQSTTASMSENFWAL